MNGISAVSIEDLNERTSFEDALLLALYEFTDESELFRDRDGVVFPPDRRAPPSQTLFARGVAHFGDWRPGFLTHAAPLVLSAAFKQLDMLVEWIVLQQQQSCPWKFADKINLLPSLAWFPHPLDKWGWLRDRVVALYGRLAAARNAIAHKANIISENGGVDAGGVQMSAVELRTFAELVCAIKRCIVGEWTVSAFLERKMRYLADGLQYFHGCALLGQARPSLVNARMYEWDSDVVRVSVEPLLSMLAQRGQREDCVPRIRLVLVSKSSDDVSAFQIPLELFVGTDVVLTTDLRSTTRCAVPSDVHVSEVRAGLLRRDEDAGGTAR